jgi:peroxiredoxin
VEDAGVEIIAISPDPNERSQGLADRLDACYRFLTDRDLEVSRRVGLVHAGAGPEGQDVPKPASILIDRDGVVRWAKYASNIQARPDPAEILTAVRAL